MKKKVFTKLKREERFTYKQVSSTPIYLVLYASLQYV